MKPGIVTGWTDDIQPSPPCSQRRCATASSSGPDGRELLRDERAQDADHLGTLNCSDVPVVEIELGNMKNASEAGRMSIRKGRTQYANGIVFGIRRYLGR